MGVSVADPRIRSVRSSGSKGSGMPPADVTARTVEPNRSAPFARIAGLWRLRPPAASFAVAPLLLAPPIGAQALHDLGFGVLLLFVVERAVARIVAAAPGPLRLEPFATAVAAALAVAAAALHSPGLLLLVLLLALCEIGAHGRWAALAGPVCLALATALRVDAGALLLGADRSLFLPLLIGCAVLLVALARRRLAPSASVGPARVSGRGALDLLLLGAFALLSSLALALLAELGLLGERPSPWALAGWSLLVAAGLATLAAADRPGAAEGRLFGLSAGAAGGALVSLVLAVGLAGSG